MTAQDWSGEKNPNLNKTLSNDCGGGFHSHFFLSIEPAMKRSLLSHVATIIGTIIIIFALVIIINDRSGAFQNFNSTTTMYDPCKEFLFSTPSTHKCIIIPGTDNREYPWNSDESFYERMVRQAIENANMFNDTNIILGTEFMLLMDETE
jgi:hypothetical protein